MKMLSTMIDGEKINLRYPHSAKLPHIICLYLTIVNKSNAALW